MLDVRKEIQRVTSFFFEICFHLFFSGYITQNCFFTFPFPFDMKTFFFALIFASVSLFAQVTAYINMETVFNEYYKTISENIKFEESHQQFVAGAALLRDEFENTRKDYLQALNDAQNDLLGDAARQAAVQRAQMLETRLGQKQEEIMHYRQEAMQEIEANQQRVTRAIVADLQEQLTKYAAEQNIELVYEVSGKTMNQVPVLMVYPKDKEITDAFVRVINAGHEAEKEEAKVRLEAARAASLEQAKSQQAPQAK